MNHHVSHQCGDGLLKYEIRYLLVLLFCGHSLVLGSEYGILAGWGREEVKYIDSFGE